MSERAVKLKQNFYNRETDGAAAREVHPWRELPMTIIPKREQPHPVSDR
jgi:hypothetical protein